MSKNLGGAKPCGRCASVFAERERLLAVIAELRITATSHRVIQQRHRDMIGGGYVHPSFWTDGPEQRRAWAEQPLTPRLESTRQSFEAAEKRFQAGCEEEQ
jgi:hypothetical protein